MGWGLNRQGCPREGIGPIQSQNTIDINYLEMLAILLGLQIFAKDKNITHIGIMCDNTTAVHNINHMGTSHSDLSNSVAKEILEWFIVGKIWLSAAHIPRKHNLITDFESRRNQENLSCSLTSCHFLVALRG